MTNIVENWSDITGKILLIRRDETNNAFSLVRLQILEKKAYGKYPDLVIIKNDGVLEVGLAHSAVEKLNLREGMIIRGLIRAAKPNIFFFKPESIKIK
jgi:hypothetical protein